MGSKIKILYTNGYSDTFDYLLIKGDNSEACIEKLDDFVNGYMTMEQVIDSGWVIDDGKVSNFTGTYELFPPLIFDMKSKLQQMYEYVNVDDFIREYNTMTINLNSNQYDDFIKVENEEEEK